MLTLKMYEDYIAYGIKYVRAHSFGTFVVAITHDQELNLFIESYNINNSDKNKDTNKIKKQR